MPQRAVIGVYGTTKATTRASLASTGFTTLDVGVGVIGTKTQVGGRGGVQSKGRRRGVVGVDGGECRWTEALVAWQSQPQRTLQRGYP